jgi:hypothetical protein
MNTQKIKVVGVKLQDISDIENACSLVDGRLLEGWTEIDRYNENLKAQYPNDLSKQYEFQATNNCLAAEVELPEGAHVLGVSHWYCAGWGNGAGVEEARLWFTVPTHEPF